MAAGRRLALLTRMGKTDGVSFYAITVFMHNVSRVKMNVECVAALACWLSHAGQVGRQTSCSCAVQIYGKGATKRKEDAVNCLIKKAREGEAWGILRLFWPEVSKSKKVSSASCVLTL